VQQKHVTGWYFGTFGLERFLKKSRVPLKFKAVEKN
jgi:hypothetical protein